MMSDLVVLLDSTVLLLLSGHQKVHHYVPSIILVVIIYMIPKVNHPCSEVYSGSFAVSNKTINDSHPLYGNIILTEYLIFIFMTTDPATL